MGCAGSREDKITDYSDNDDGMDKSMVAIAEDDSRKLARAVSNGSFIFAPENTANATNETGGAEKEVAAENSAEEVLPVNEYTQDGVTYWVEYVPNGQVFADEQSEENDPDIIGK